MRAAAPDARNRRPSGGPHTFLPPPACACDHQFSRVARCGNASRHTRARHRRLPALYLVHGGPSEQAARRERRAAQAEPPVAVLRLAALTSISQPALSCCASCNHLASTRAASAFAHPLALFSRPAHTHTHTHTHHTHSPSRFPRRRSLRRPSQTGWPHTMVPLSISALAAPCSSAISTYSTPWHLPEG